MCRTMAVPLAGASLFHSAKHLACTQISKCSAPPLQPSPDPSSDMLCEDTAGLVHMAFTSYVDSVKLIGVVLPHCNMERTRVVGGRIAVRLKVPGLRDKALFYTCGWLLYNCRLQ
ncbi:hypothetical protein P171DRAFT_26585 [Karstenula rhodostoma CBS 690.94]|uniref:Uncharacterized protein n=1 Tax=Karstenula rhodostoma CBS 690.94 TaxID=1392251 RepID=A0A9P4PHI2_9PLEO|nr:hypothetical protein P171DRAFT_26585 [Karstenula rhodostoma CBS 690.94]